ncbi:Sjogren's syndrome/scleroderma autoantigen 1 family protein [Haloarcula onubensis]|uniref:Sjogren's syndrome/scleroderma autoantigen 1 (Autoantigen p27) n=1 Tax=Haloarcula onubensis TaxID=2950539 RepID=A0ABU2FP76_9EURY|nr:Sjogren's syndrome/scleroderma autoantigen 1 family protein [Halomicroarcula sp. S3CR25-11]MDS0282567.1 hypothetical protein [Halomicroarcula sp. S3CR25-11]
MSDFDKEAEREKLREKYGEEEEKRKATEQMSELLLKGATMTNAHCTDCGDPIFRYDGQEFCPTCQKPVARDDPSEGEDHIEVADPSDEAKVQFGDGQDGADEGGTEHAADASAAAADDQQPTAGQQPTSDQSASAATADIPSADPDRTRASGDAGVREADAHSGDAGVREADAHSGDAGVREADAHSGDAGVREADAHSGDAGGREADAHSGDTATDPTTDRAPAPAPTSGRGTGDPVTAELSAAESLLAETVNRFAQRAADTDDPRTAREHLKAAREAAEALDAVRF